MNGLTERSTVSSASSTVSSANFNAKFSGKLSDVNNISPRIEP